jgi:hypothetical protein
MKSTILGGSVGTLKLLFHRQSSSANNSEKYEGIFEHNGGA